MDSTIEFEGVCLEVVAVWDIHLDFLVFPLGEGLGIVGVCIRVHLFYR